MQQANESSSFVLNLSDHEGIAEALAGKGPGDTCKVTLTIKVGELSGETLRGSIMQFVPEGYKIEEESEEEYEESDDAPPIVQVLASKSDE